MVAALPPTPADNVHVEIQGAVGLITLDRPKALNALSQAMCVAIDRALAAWAHDPQIAVVAVRGAGGRAFCAGGDVRAVYEDLQAVRRGDSDGTLIRELFAHEYRMNWRIKNFPKPYVALIDGITMGGGIGLSVHGSHRVATERTLAAMPETGIGLFPDVGASYALPRLPGETGTLMALAGLRLKAADLHYVGIATHCTLSDRLDAIVEYLVAADWSGDAYRTVDAILDLHAFEAGESELADHRALIDRCFAHDRVEAILAALDGAVEPFAAEIAAIIRTMSPSSLKVTLEEMRRGRTMDFNACMAMEYRLTQTVIHAHDFSEGVRAVLVDKDHTPKWSPVNLAGVDDASIPGYFVEPPSGDLTFPEAT